MVCLSADVIAPANAQQADESEETTRVVDDVVVTASRIAETADETLAPVSVITRDDIETRQIRSVPEALRSVPGLSLTNNGGQGKATSVFLRGTESDHVLVLINGVKVGSATLGTFNFESLSIDNVERIEVVRGPRSQLYGSEALGGIIQIFTRRPTDDVRVNASAGYGSDETKEAFGGFSGRTAGIGYAFDASYLETDGFNACGDGKSVPSGGCFANEPDDDGFRRTSIDGRLDYTFANGVAIDLTGLYADSDNDFDGSFVNESEAENYVLGGQVRFSPVDVWDVTASAGHTVDDSDNFLNGTFRSRFKTERNSLSLQNDLFLADGHVTTLGGDYQLDEVSGTTDYDEDRRDNYAAFVQHRVDFGRHSIQASGRVDENEQFGGFLTGGVSYGLRIVDGLRMTLAYGTAFKAPTFNELFFPGFGNSDLDPEESQSAEIGLTARVGEMNLGANLFRTEIDDLISFDAATSAPANVDEAEITGLELYGSGTIEGFIVLASATFLDPVNESDGSNNGNLLPRRAEQFYQLSIDHNVGDLGLGLGELSLGGDVRYESERFDDLANSTELDAYTTVDLRARYDVTENWGLDLKLVNIFDEDYETARFFNQQGRAGFLRLTFRN